MERNRQDFLPLVQRKVLQNSQAVQGAVAEPSQRLSQEGRVDLGGGPGDFQGGER